MHYTCMCVCVYVHIYIYIYIYIYVSYTKAPHIHKSTPHTQKYAPHDPTAITGASRRAAETRLMLMLAQYYH